MSPQAFIKLTPPLPFLLDETISGFVVELSATQLKIKLVHRPARIFSGAPLSPHQLALSTEEGTVHRLLIHGQDVEPQTDSLTVDAADAAARNTLTDLLNILRKEQHITICQTQDVEASDRFTGFSELNFLPRTIPELNWQDIDPSTTFLGRGFKAPILITGMTGGIEKGAEINRRLAIAAARFGIPMGVGSQRIAIENSEHAAIFAVKKWAPDLFCIANIGAAQAIGPGAVDICRRVTDMIQADALAIHVNVLQEAVQVEGDRCFRGLLANIEKIVKASSVPVIVKEVGAGMDLQTAERLLACGVNAIDVGGKGGTSWSHIEGERSSSPTVQELGRVFRDWGIPTAYSLKALTDKFPQHEFTATGGIRDGITVAKAIALGARMAGIGLPLFRAALVSEEATQQVIESLLQQLKTTMLCVGATTLDELKQHIVFGRPYENLWTQRQLSGDSPQAYSPSGIPFIFQRRCPTTVSRSGHDGGSRYDI